MPRENKNRKQLSYTITIQVWMMQKTERKMLLLFTFKNTGNTFGWGIKAWPENSKTDGKKSAWSFMLSENPPKDKETVIFQPTL